MAEKVYEVVEEVMVQGGIVYDFLQMKATIKRRVRSDLERMIKRLKAKYGKRAKIVIEPEVVAITIKINDREIRVKDEEHLKRIRTLVRLMKEERLIKHFDYKVKVRTKVSVYTP